MKLRLQDAPPDLEEIDDQILNLRSKINTCNFNYYVLGEASLDDHEYDLLVDELNQLERKKATSLHNN